MFSPAANYILDWALATASRSSTRRYPLSADERRGSAKYRLDEALVDEDKVTHQGRFYTLNDAGIG